MTTKKKGSLGYYKELAKEVGYPNEIEGFNIGPFLKWARENGILVDPTDVERKVLEKSIENAGCKNPREYRNKCAQKLGFKDGAEKQKEWRWNKGIHSPISENEDCSSWFGEFISQNYVMKTFEDPIKMPPGNPGFDWLCKKGQKIDHKGACLQFIEGKSPFWLFNIKYNDITDYFILSAWDNRDSLIPLHVWIFHKNDIVRGRKFWRRDSFSITNKPKYLEELKKYEVTDRLEKLKELCHNDV